MPVAISALINTGKSRTYVCQSQTSDGLQKNAISWDLQERKPIAYAVSLRQSVYLWVLGTKTKGKVCPNLGETPKFGLKSPIKGVSRLKKTHIFENFQFFQAL